MSSNSVNYVHRPTGETRQEKIYGEDLLDLLIENPLGRAAQNFLSTSKIPSKIMGHFESSPLSIPLINPFIKKYEIPMGDFIDKSYTSFNDFFIRRFKSGVRPFENDKKRFPAPCEARYLFKENISLSESITVKDHSFSVKNFLNNLPGIERFEGGDILLARLCPVDYHRFHFSLDGQAEVSVEVAGKLLSVNPKGISQTAETLAVNERNITIFTPLNSHKKIAIIEIGAMMVGKIVQSFTPECPVHRGDEKGFFLFGASASALVFEQGFVKFDQDILDNSQKGIETWIPMGSAIGDILDKDYYSNPHETKIKSQES